MTLTQDLQNLIDAECAKANTQSVILGVHSGDGQVDFRGGAGTAAPNTRFPIASITKMFTATLILQLADEGRIGLDQTVQSILADVDLSGLHVVKGVDFGARLTVRQLLHQTSGLADYYESDLAVNLKQNIDLSYGLDDVLRMTTALPPQAAPDSGKSYYSDTNYQLLGAVIEAVTGQPFEQAMQSRICRPLGLKDTAMPQGTDVGLAVYHKDQALNISQTLTSMGPDGRSTDLFACLHAKSAVQTREVCANAPMEPALFPAVLRVRFNADQIATLDDAVSRHARADRAFRGKRVFCFLCSGTGYLSERDLQPARRTAASHWFHAAGAACRRQTREISINAATTRTLFYEPTVRFTGMNRP